MKNKIYIYIYISTIYSVITIYTSFSFRPYDFVIRTLEQCPCGKVSKCSYHNIVRFIVRLAYAIIRIMIVNQKQYKNNYKTLNNIFFIFIFNSQTRVNKNVISFPSEKTHISIYKRAYILYYKRHCHVLV